MERRLLGRLFEVSRLTLGGGGIGQVWGETSREEAIATVVTAHEAGIDLFDLAPIYGDDGEAETVMGLSFGGTYPEGLRVTTKCMLGGTAPDQIEARLMRSLEESLRRMKREHVDIYILHGYVIPDGWQDCTRPAVLPHVAVEWSNYVDHVIPTFEKLKAGGAIGGWGITAASVQETNLGAIGIEPAPDVVQCVANLLDAYGGMRLANEAPDPRAVIRAAKGRSVGVMAIRPVAAGALTGAIDRELPPDSAERRDFDRAAGFRALATELGVNAAVLAHRYALSMPGVDTVVLGVKNREELRQCLDAVSVPELDPSVVRRVDAAVSRID